MLTLENINAELLNQWMTVPVSFKGQFNADAQVAVSAEGVRMNASLTDMQETAAKIGEGTVSITDSPSPSISISGSADPALEAFKVESLTLHGFGAVHLDEAMIGELRKSLRPAPGSAIDETLSRMQKGGSFSFGNFQLTGGIDAAHADPEFSGSFTLASLNVGNENDPDHPANIEDLTLKATIRERPLTSANFAQRLNISDARVQARRLTLENTQTTGISAAIDMVNAKGTIKEAAFSLLTRRLFPGRLSSRRPTASTICNFTSRGSIRKR